MKERELVRSNEELDERVIGNPIHAYKTVKRFAIDLKKIENDLQEDDWKGIYAWRKIRIRILYKVILNENLCHIDGDYIIYFWSPETEFKIKKRKLGNVLPREEDLHGSAQALIRLQDTYELDIRDFAEGEIGRGRNLWTTTARLSAQVTCSQIPRH